MKEQDDRPVTKRTKAPYESPTAVELGFLKAGVGACTSGNAPTKANHCTTGVAAPGVCRAGANK